MKLSTLALTSITACLTLHTLRFLFGRRNDTLDMVLVCLGVVAAAVNLILAIRWVRSSRTA